MRLGRLFLPFIALLAACSPVPGSAQPARLEPVQLAEPSRRAPSEASAVKMSFAPVVRRTAGAVVNVSARRIVRPRVDPFWELFGGGMPRARVEQSLGSGVIVRSDGVVVTNNHVVEGGQDFTIVLNDGREFSAQLLLADPRTDLAVLKADVKERLPVLAIDDRSDLQVGDLVLAIGNPFGVGQTVTNGIISALNRSPNPASDAGSFIQTDAAINPGNSGGALVDMDGDLIGINSFILSRSGTSSGVGFAIPAAMVRRIVESAAGGSHTLIRPWIGAKSDPVTSDVARSLGLAAPGGALVTDVYPGGPASRAGVREGDVVIAVDGTAVADPANLNFKVATKRPGDRVQLEVLRNRQKINLAAAVEPPPASPSRDERQLNGDYPLTGVTVANLSPALADELGLDPFLRGGALVTRVSGSSYAASAGFQPGDIVRNVNGATIGSTADLQRILNAGARGYWTVTIERDGKLISARFRS